jgi:hypothetical protein
MDITYSAETMGIRWRAMVFTMPSPYLKLRTLIRPVVSDEVVQVDASTCLIGRSRREEQSGQEKQSSVAERVGVEKKAAMNRRSPNVCIELLLKVRTKYDTMRVRCRFNDGRMQLSCVGQDKRGTRSAERCRILIERHSVPRSALAVPHSPFRARRVVSDKVVQIDAIGRSGPTPLIPPLRKCPEKRRSIDEFGGTFVGLKFSPDALQTIN